MDLLDDAGADLVDAVLVEAHDDRRRRPVLRDEIAADEVVLERAAPDVGRIARGDVLEERPDLEAALVWRSWLFIASTMVAVARLLTCWTVSTRSMSPVIAAIVSSVARENSRSAESALSAMMSARVPPNSLRNRS